jgi:hypothetical protein
MRSMKYVTCLLLVAFACLSDARAQGVTRDIPYATAHERQVLDVYAPAGAKNLPVVFWIHGGGWQAGDKTMVALKPKAFMDAGFVFVSISHRLLPTVDMGALTGDVASALGSDENEPSRSRILLTESIGHSPFLPGIALGISYGTNLTRCLHRSSVAT